MSRRPGPASPCSVCGYHSAPTITHLVCIAEFWKDPSWEGAKRECEEYKKTLS
ncbi:MAG: hypothetical protein K6E55_07895 [Thermoguttaceae bacterium]|nr:hypothetical protein [Thermoguttaceae bacterium]